MKLLDFITLSEESKLLGKPTPSVEVIAKKHNVSNDYIKTQLKAGIKVELEHTNDPKIAKEIASDHLAERPDYYKRLKKVEVDESIQSNDFTKILKYFLPLAKKVIDLDRMPAIILRKYIGNDDQPTMGFFNSDTYTIETAIANRQPVDALRTIAHELVHAKQHSMGIDLDGATGSPEENDANMIAGIVMRKFNKQYPKFLRFEPVTEGGNVQIGQAQAQRIELQKITRSSIVPEIDQLLRDVNLAYSQKFGKPVWSPELIKSKKFLSGSAFHFFNNKIPDEQFVKVKPTVGDIDTQVDKNDKENIQQFLDAIQGRKFGAVTFIGYKPSGEQFITLWDFANHPIKIQIDLELVDFEKGEPTQWAQFSHSSTWDDIQAGIKGVFHKYLLRAFTTPSLKDRYILMKSGKLKKVTSTDLASSDRGIRRKYEPAIDPSTGEQQIIDGLLVFKELNPKDSVYTNNVVGMFEMLFGQKPSADEAKLMWSFTGGLQLANKFLDQEGKRKLANGFMLTIFGPQAQELYKNNPQDDQKEKEIAWNLMLSTLGLTKDSELINSANQAKKDFYANYKQKESIAEDVKASPRQGIQHLQKMNDLEFINWVKDIRHTLEGKLNSVKMTLKIDGIGARFGRDADGRPFFESSRSGPVFTDGHFIGHAKSRGFEGELLQRAEQYEEIFKIITTSDFIMKLPKDSKVACEVLYNPMGEETANGYRFLTVAYDRKMLGQKMTVVPFDSEVASTGERHPKSDRIKDFLTGLGEVNGIKFIDDRLGYDGDIDLTAEIDPILSIVNANLIAKLTSRLKADKEEKLEIKAFIQAAKDSIANFILTHPGVIGKEKLGKDIEGVILHRGTQAPVKVTTPQFKQEFAAKKQGQQNATTPAV